MDGAVAALVYWSPAEPENKKKQLIEASAEIDIGRNTVRRALGIEDRCVSSHHLRVRCIDWADDATPPRVQPMLYLRVLSSSPVVLTRNDSNKTLYPDVEITREGGDILLSPGDSVQLTANVCVGFRLSSEHKYEESELDGITKAEVRNFQRDYRLTNRVLGYGGFATVYVAVKTKTGQQLACKVVELPASMKHDGRGHAIEKESSAADAQQKRKDTAREYRLLMAMSHPHIVGVEKIFQTNNNVYIFQELLTGGDLVSYMAKHGRLTEAHAAIIVRQLLEAVKYLHDNRIAHRDIKTENILMSSWREGCRIVLADFGQAQHFADMNATPKRGLKRRMMTLAVGTDGYRAPEIEQGKSYTEAIDIWAVGSVLGHLIASPNSFPEGAELRMAAAKTESQWGERIDNSIAHTEEWKNMSGKAKAFIRGCLTAETNRLTAAQCLELKWFRHMGYKDEFDAAYRRAIQDWKPIQHTDDTVEIIDTSYLRAEFVKTGSESDEKETESRSHYFHKQDQEAAPAPDFASQIGRVRSDNTGLHASQVRAPDMPHRRAAAPAPTQSMPFSFLQNGSETLNPRVSDSLVGLQPPDSFPDSFPDIDENFASLPKPPADTLRAVTQPQSTSNVNAARPKPASTLISARRKPASTFKPAPPKSNKTSKPVPPISSNTLKSVQPKSNTTFRTAPYNTHLRNVLHR